MFYFIYLKRSDPVERMIKDMTILIMRISKGCTSLFSIASTIEEPRSSGKSYGTKA